MSKVDYVVFKQTDEANVWKDVGGFQAHSAEMAEIAASKINGDGEYAAVAASRWSPDSYEAVTTIRVRKKPTA